MKLKTNKVYLYRKVGDMLTANIYGDLSGPANQKIIAEVEGGYLVVFENATYQTPYFVSSASVGEPEKKEKLS